VHFLDVGQGDAVLIQTPEGKNLLLDGGERGAGGTVIAYLRQQGVTALDLVIASHPHEDHIGGLLEVLTAFPVKTLLDSGYVLGTPTQERLLELVRERGVRYRLGRAGNVIRAGPCTLEVLAPEEPLLHDTESDANNNSLVLRLIYGQTAFLFTGDLEEAGRQRLLRHGREVRSQVLKVAHHGSRNGTDEKFVAAVQPQVAIISCGANNSYGHPHREALRALRLAQVHVYTTRDNGNIVVTSDGQQIAVCPERGGELIVRPRLRPSAGKSPSSSPRPAAEKQEIPLTGRYIGNRNSKVFHGPECKTLPAPRNRVLFPTREAALQAGYRPCRRCQP